MDILIKQTRARLSSTRQDNRGDTGDRSTQPERTQSARDKKRGQSWIKRQFSRQMSWENDFSGVDYPTAVAAAAYAIQSLEESKSRDWKDLTSGVPDKNLSKMKSKVDDTRAPPEPLKSVLKSSDEASRASFKDRDGSSTSSKKPEKAPSIKKKISFADVDEDSNKNPEGTAGKKEPERAPSTKRPKSPADKQLNISDIKTPETAHPSFEPRRVPGAKLGPADAKADAWEKEELASIGERYEKLRATIDDWEGKKKKKAKRRIERIEAELDKRRTKAVKDYHSEITRIEGIAGGARAQAEQNRRNEEFKAKEKANKIRSTGKLPPTCLCF